MRNSAIERVNTGIFLVVAALSAGTMVWLFWHHPIKTVIGTIAVLAALGMSARLARAIEAEAGELERSEQSI
jgi:predicted benzoate:H+ symporter BenE